MATTLVHVGVDGLGFEVDALLCRFSAFPASVLVDRRLRLELPHGRHSLVLRVDRHLFVH